MSGSLWAWQVRGLDMLAGQKDLRAWLSLQTNLTLTFFYKQFKKIQRPQVLRAYKSCGPSKNRIESKSCGLVLFSNGLVYILKHSSKTIHTISLMKIVIIYLDLNPRLRDYSIITRTTRLLCGLLCEQEIALKILLRSLHHRQAVLWIMYVIKREILQKN